MDADKLEAICRAYFTLMLKIQTGFQMYISTLMDAGTLRKSSGGHFFAHHAAVMQHELICKPAKAILLDE
jgi:hypothetical protein